MDKELKLLKRFYIDQTDQYFKTMSKIEKKLDKGINKNNLHSVRLNIKNIRAVHQFFKIMGIENKTIEKLENQINKINKPLGRIRERQVNKGLAKKSLLNNKIHKAYLSYLKVQMDKDFLKLKKKLTPETLSLKTYHFNRISKELLEQDENLIIPKLNIFLLERVDIINQLLVNMTDEKNIHQIRKSLKTIKAVITVLKIEGLADIKEFKKDINRTEHHIGDWHDSVVFRDSLLDFCTSYPEYEEMININLELIEADNLMFQSQLPDMIQPLVSELGKSLEKKEPV